MSLQNIAFKTRARTIDHLGREQIADCPTAVSELWKNSYDAYAREVTLHIFDGANVIAGVYDDGHGMNSAEFVDKWLTIGTESKAVIDYGTKGEEFSRTDDRDGLPKRPKQGQKGIGRLSSAALGPLLLVISKRKNDLFVAALVDWRLFENPFIFLEDIRIPVVDFAEKEDIFSLLPSMFDTLMSNVWGTPDDVKRSDRINLAWSKLDAQEYESDRPSTKNAIESVIIDTVFLEKHLQNWAVWQGTSEKGTAMIIADVVFDLQAQLPSRFRIGSGYQTALHARERMLQTLSNFTDPFIDTEKEYTEFSAEFFKYSVTAWEGDLPQSIISDTRKFDYLKLSELEHVIEGEIDEAGIFRGRVKAFGKWLQEVVTILPSEPTPTRSDSRVGPFKIRLGTFEQDIVNTTHSPAVHAQLRSDADIFAGFRIYRNGLRMMPYGREDNDFFDIEKRRGKNAGREYWSFRNLFGRVAISRDQNGNLRDKAGREGIIENRAAKAFRDIVINILMVSARRYFGSASEIRSLRLPEIRANNEKSKAEEAEKKIKTRKRQEFRKNLKSYMPLMIEIFSELSEIGERAVEQALPNEEKELLNLRDRISELKTRKAEINLGTAPKSLGPLETEYKKYRDAEIKSSALISQLLDATYLILERIKPKSTKELVYSNINKNAAYLHHRLRRWSLEIKNILQDETKRVAGIVDNLNKIYHEKTLPLLEIAEGETRSLASILAELDSIKESLDIENSDLFVPYIATLKNLQDSIDLENLLAFSSNSMAEMKLEIERLNSLAQLGITVEIIGHEIEDLESAVTNGLRALPPAIKETQNYRNIKTSHESLSDRLKFLSPLKLSGENSQVWITGENIFSYVGNFFKESLKDKDIKFEASESFKRLSIYERPSRIFPVFVNLVNNSAYWLGHGDISKQKKIFLHYSGDKVIVSDSGPGVDQEDVRQLFLLFFTKKVRGGRGVGLYLCRANLAAGGHTITYITEKKDKILTGANFAIDFKGIRNV